MILSLLSVTLPLAIGLYRDEMKVSIYGSLFAFNLVLNDHFGPYKQRVVHLFTTFLFLTTAFYLGFLASGSTIVILVGLGILSFLIGRCKGLGLELERLLLITTLQFLAGSQSFHTASEVLMPLIYAALSFVDYLVCLTVVFLIMRHSPNFQKSKRKEFLESLRRKNIHRYAITLSIFSCLGFLISEYFALAKGYWMVGTILIVMMPSKSDSIHRSLQRLLGTMVGVVLASLLMYFRKDEIFLISFSGICAFFTPFALLRNYWLANVFIAGLILFYLTIAEPIMYGPFDLAWMRLSDIAMGCILGTIGTFFAWPDKKPKL